MSCRHASPRKAVARRELLRQLIVDPGRWEPLSSRALVEILGRGDRKHLVREFLSPMVAEGLLTCTIPAMEKHPDQRYAAVAEDA